VGKETWLIFYQLGGRRGVQDFVKHWEVKLHLGEGQKVLQVWNDNNAQTFANQF
jgi:hypothetical protein